MQGYQLMKAEHLTELIALNTPMDTWIVIKTFAVDPNVSIRGFR